MNRLLVCFLVVKVKDVFPLRGEKEKNARCDVGMTRKKLEEEKVSLRVLTAG